MGLRGQMGLATICKRMSVRSYGVQASVLVLGLGVSVGVLARDASRAYACSAVTEQARQDERAYTAGLSDCRAYEQVSPAYKNSIDAVGSSGLVHASPDGQAVTFFAVAPFPGTIGSAEAPTYLGVRALAGDKWSTRGLEALAPAGATEEVAGVTEDLSATVLNVGQSQFLSAPCEPALTVCATFGQPSAYIRDDATGSFQLLTATEGPSIVYFADSTPGASRIIFETSNKLTKAAQPGVNLYEWNESKPPTERISLVGVLPSKEAVKEGSLAGAGGPASERVPGGASKKFYTRHTISEDGSRIFFSDVETGIVYMREPEAERTIQVSAGAPAVWLDATPDGHYVFYSENQELYRYNVLSATRETLTSGAEGVLGALGVSDDGSYAYFVAQGKLPAATNRSGNGEEAIDHTEEEEEVTNTGAHKNNLYEWHGGAIIFIARLQGANSGERKDEADWRGYAALETESDGPSGGQKSARVAPDGKSILFSSVLPLSSYDNNGNVEFYLYKAEQPLSSENPVCVSCNPRVTPATDGARLTARNAALTAFPDGFPYLTRNLSDNGRRVFFQTNEALVPADANSQGDVYEWEADGEGSCGSEILDRGCLYLISTGQSSQQSYFGDASADGSSAFFFTRQSLVSQDQDNNSDFYDARVEGGISGQNPPAAPVPCAEETACRGALSSTSSVFGAPSSTTVLGTGNPAPHPSPVPPKKKTAAQVKAEKLAKALKACKSRPKAKRKGCELAARKRYGTRAKARKKGKIRGSGRS